jgi:hypothetical protein
MKKIETPPKTLIGNVQIYGSEAPSPSDDKRLPPSRCGSGTPVTSGTVGDACPYNKRELKTAFRFY